MPRGQRYLGPVDEKSIGRRIREVRKRRGLTQVELAQQLGIDQSLLSNYERGIVRIHGGLVAGLARVLRVTADELLGLQAPSGEAPVSDRRFLRRLQRVGKLSKRDKDLLLGTMDAFLLKVS